MGETGVVLASGYIGIIDAALVRWLTQQKAHTARLVVRVTQSLFEPLLPKEHLEQFLTALEPVDAVLSQGCTWPEMARQYGFTIGSVTTCAWPEAELLSYSMARICKHCVDLTEAASAGKLTSLAALRDRYGPLPGRRRMTVGVVSGSFDVIHSGHIRLLQAAKQLSDVLVVLAMSTQSVQMQDKNCNGDRPIYSEKDRAEVLAALLPVDHIVMFDERDCRACLQSFCPDRFIKSEFDRLRPIVRAEAALVENLGGETLYLANHHPGYSSTTIIRYIREQAAARLAAD
jgi:rfaE bifunctional protein nucleotidyltransferase chain/domain